MSKLDELIREALDGEEQALVAATEEQGWFALMFGIFSGPLGWMSWLVSIVQAALFFAGLWAAVHFFRSVDVLAAVKWGLSAAVLLLAGFQLKLSLMPQIHADRVIRQIRRLELVLLQK